MPFAKYELFLTGSESKSRIFNLFFKHKNIVYSLSRNLDFELYLTMHSIFNLDVNSEIHRII